MSKFYFIRHGQTEWNLEKRFQGKNGDSPLLGNIDLQVDQITNFFNNQGIAFDKIYTSPIQRAAITAEKINQKLQVSRPIFTDELIVEINLGDWEGHTFEEIINKYPKLYDNYRNHPEKFDNEVINAESFIDVQLRFKHFVDEILNSESEFDKNYLIVSHGAALQAGVSGLLGEPIAKLRQRGGLTNLSSTILDITKQKVKLLVFNNTNYLNVSIGRGNTLE